jgi:hypothetical protein
MGTPRVRPILSDSASPARGAHGRIRRSQCRPGDRAGLPRRCIKAIARVGGIARSLPVERDHPAFRGGTIAFAAKRSSGGGTADAPYTAASARSAGVGRALGRVKACPHSELGGDSLRGQPRAILVSTGRTEA